MEFTQERIKYLNKYYVNIPSIYTNSSKSSTINSLVVYIDYQQIFNKTRQYNIQFFDKSYLFEKHNFIENVYIVLSY